MTELMGRINAADQTGTVIGEYFQDRMVEENAQA